MQLVLLEIHHMLTYLFKQIISIWRCLLVNRKQHKLLQSYLLKVNHLIKYMYETMLVMQPVMFFYTQEGMHVSQIQLTWKKHGADTMAHGIFYVCHNTFVDE